MKWISIQPLTGGMYLGAKNAIGNDAEYIISFPGLNDTKIDKEGNIISAGNDYNITNYLVKKGCNVPYYTFNCGMFDNININEAEVNGDVDYSDIDLVVAVPVCSGLSQATIAEQGTKDKRNGNMTFIARYTLGIIKPKVYIFENAPALFSDNGKRVRDVLDGIAEEYGYSVIYYKTDTKYHDNCQRRPRTFVVFVKYRDNETGAPLMNFEDKQTTLDEYLSRIPENTTQQFAVDMEEYHNIYLDYLRSHYGPDWRDKTRLWMVNNIVEENLWEDLFDFTRKYENASEKSKDKLIKTFTHFRDKVEMGLSYYATLPMKPNGDTIQSAIFKTIPTLLHHKEYRLFTIREWLHFMGMPFDFELQGNPKAEYAKIGQNVPVRTAQWIVSEAKRIIDNWETIDRTGDKTKYIDNTKKKIYE